jgi:hypothetical protein
MKTIKTGKANSSCSCCGVSLEGEEYVNPHAGSRAKVCLECREEDHSSPGVDVLLFSGESAHA